MQIRQKRLQFYPALRFLTLFCVTMLAPPCVWISRSGEMMFSVMRTFSEVHLSFYLEPLSDCVSGGQMDLIADHIRNIFSRESLVKNQRPWRFPLPINISSAAGPAWWGSDAKGRIYKNLSNNATLGFPTKLLCLDSAKFLFTLCLIKICWLLNGSVRLQWCPVSQGPDDVHPDFKISPRSLHLAWLLSRAILDFTRTFSRDDSRFQNIPNIFYGQDPFRSIVKSFHEIYCKAAIQHNASERGCLGQTNGPHL